MASEQCHNAIRLSDIGGCLTTAKERLSYVDYNDMFKAAVTTLALDGVYDKETLKRWRKGMKKKVLAEALIANAVVMPPGPNVLNASSHDVNMSIVNEVMMLHAAFHSSPSFTEAPQCTEVDLHLHFSDALAACGYCGVTEYVMSVLRAFIYQYIRPKMMFNSNVPFPVSS